MIYLNIIFLNRFSYYGFNSLLFLFQISLNISFEIGVILEGILFFPLLLISSLIPEGFIVTTAFTVSTIPYS